MIRLEARLSDHGVFSPQVLTPEQSQVTSTCPREVGAMSEDSLVWCREKMLVAVYHCLSSCLPFSMQSYYYYAHKLMFVYIYEIAANHQLVVDICLLFWIPFVNFPVVHCLLLLVFPALLH